jgi:hypothetical protein
VVPTQFRVLVIRRPRYACRACGDAVVQAPAPARLIEGGLPTGRWAAPPTLSSRRYSSPNTLTTCRSIGPLAGRTPTQVVAALWSRRTLEGSRCPLDLHARPVTPPELTDGGRGCSDPPRRRP